MASSAVDDAHATVAQMKAPTNEFLQAFTGFSDGEAVQIQVGLDRKTAGSQGLQKKMSLWVRRSLNVFAACDQIDRSSTRDKLHKEFQALILTSMRISNLNRNHASPCRFTAPSQRKHVSHGDLEEILVGEIFGPG